MSPTSSISENIKLLDLAGIDWRQGQKVDQAIRFESRFPLSQGKGFPRDKGNNVSDAMVVSVEKSGGSLSLGKVVHPSLVSAPELK